MKKPKNRRHEDRLIATGHRRTSFWVHRDDYEQVRELVARLRHERKVRTAQVESIL